MSENIRLIRKDELDKLLNLYKHLNDDDPDVNENIELEGLWTDICNDSNIYYIVAESDGFTVKKLADIERIISQCEEETRNLFMDLSHKNAQLVKEEIKDYKTEEQLLF